MRAKEYLQQIQMLDLKIAHKIQQKEDLLSRLSSVSVGLGTPDKVQTGRNLDPLGNDMAHYLDMEQEIDALVNQFIILKDKIINQIHQLPDANHVDLLHKRYVEYKTWEQIAVEMNYTIRWVYCLHGQALQEFANKHNTSL